MAVVMLLAFQKYDGYSFLSGYNIMVFILLILNTMTLDEYYKSMPFMMTLPVKRETYVAEKYVLMLTFSLVGAVLTTIICIALHQEMAVQILIEALAIYLFMAFFQLMMLPIQLKFGGEKGRIVLMGLLGCIPIVVTSLINGLPRILGIEGALGDILRNMFTWFLSLQKGIMALLIALVFAVCGTVSYLISRRVMIRREF